MLKLKVSIDDSCLLISGMWSRMKLPFCYWNFSSGFLWYFTGVMKNEKKLSTLNLWLFVIRDCVNIMIIYCHLIKNLVFSYLAMKLTWVYVHIVKGNFYIISANFTIGCWWLSLSCWQWWDLEGIDKSIKKIKIQLTLRGRGEGFRHGH